MGTSRTQIDQKSVPELVEAFPRWMAHDERPWLAEPWVAARAEICLAAVSADIGGVDMNSGVLQVWTPNGRRASLVHAGIIRKKAKER